MKIDSGEDENGNWEQKHKEGMFIRQCWQYKNLSL